MNSNFHLLIRDTWIELPDVQAGVAKSLSRASSSMETVGGFRYEQHAPKANASWVVDTGLRDAEVSRWLTYAATGRAGAVWLYDVQAAQANMLGEAQTQGSSATLVTVEGVPMPAFGSGVSSTRKVRTGVAYSLSYSTTHTAAATIGTYDVGAGAVDIVAPAGTGSRRGSTAFVPAADGECEIVWTVADVTSGARLSEGSVSDSSFLPGENTPCRVVVSDRSQRIDFVYSDRLSRSTASFEIREVG